MGRREKGRGAVTPLLRTTDDSYRQLAYVYDLLMRDAPYGEWLAWAEQMWRLAGSHPRQVVDLACGTGTLTRALAQTGRQAIGVDLSTDMLAVADQKAADRGGTQGADRVAGAGSVRSARGTTGARDGAVTWLQQDMRELQLPAAVDSVVCFCDSLNYLLTEGDWRETFRAVYDALQPNGVFLLDIHSEYKVRTVFGNEVYAWEESGVYCVWHNELDEAACAVDEALTLFVEGEDGCYERFDEWHRQRTFPPDVVRQWLVDAGFEVLMVTGDFRTTGGVRAEDERVFFCARKR
ncbi:class I SAM-dependent DNA methyltransferase [Numidum massiliense]|uniref:class I SAM-dependent DNA methyltransferase n=1 Tax=Numidum massiliense TaxID=1522315 RepID=UPI00093ABE89|nr:class I SAM-dependent methyltransferase [Numidum massiliense]